MDFQTNKTLGGVGAILLLIGCLTFISPAVGILGLIGLILVLIALNGFADYYNEKGIFNNALYGIIIFVVIFSMFVALMLHVLAQGISISVSFSSNSSFLAI